MDDPRYQISYRGPMSEDDYLTVVERIQQAMTIEPFQPPLIDVLKLLSDWRDWVRTRDMLAEEREAWKTRALEESAENDQWQKKQTESWAEIKRLRALIERHNDECRECPVIELGSDKQG